jgi:hypothetical protein
MINSWTSLNPVIGKYDLNISSIFVSYLAENTLHICYVTSFANGIRENYYIFRELANSANCPVL